MTWGEFKQYAEELLGVEDSDHLIRIFVTDRGVQSAATFYINNNGIKAVEIYDVVNQDQMEGMTIQ